MPKNLLARNEIIELMKSGEPLKHWQIEQAKNYLQMDSMIIQDLRVRLYGARAANKQLKQQIEKLEAILHLWESGEKR